MIHDDERTPLGPSARKHGFAVRAFFAVALGEELRAQVAQLARELAARPGGDGVRWTAPESYHLTLRFLGNLAVSDVAPLAERAHDALAGCTPFALTLGAPLAFPTARNPKLIALAVEPEAALAELAARLEKAVVEQRLPSEQRAFRAHLSIGRVRTRRTPALAAVAPAGCQRVCEVVLFRSDLSHAGAQYSPLATLPLGAAAAEIAHSPFSH